MHPFPQDHLPDHCHGRAVLSNAEVLSFAERAIIRAVRAEEGDFRDWQIIRAWAESIAAELESEATRAAPTT